MTETKEHNKKTGKPENSHLPWTDDEEANLAKWFNSGKAIEEIARILKRSDLAIAARLHGKGLIDDVAFNQYQPSDQQTAG